MIVLRYLLFPFAILYGWITSIRNFLYDKGILKSYSFDIPTIVVGNLSVGGTGKTPQIEYLIRLLSQNYKIATLSRGYKRVSKGFILADENTNAEILGDEPFQIHQKFKNIMVAVDADRKNGIENILKSSINPGVILLDDAFQHRKVKAGMYILLSAYNDLFFNDFMLPTGNLRENRNNAKRAAIIIITKCPKDLSESKQQEIKNTIGLNTQVFFSFIDYDDKVYNEIDTREVDDIKETEKLLVAGIAKPKPFFDHLKNENDAIIQFPDHHHFSNKDCNVIVEKANSRLIITTEKDYVRLKNKNISNLFYLPIKSDFISNGFFFDTMVLDYMERNQKIKSS